jgi:hypothetical protein
MGCKAGVSETVSIGSGEGTVGTDGSTDWTGGASVTLPQAAAVMERIATTMKEGWIIFIAGSFGGHLLVSK